MKVWLSKRSRAGHLLTEALVGGVVLSLAIAALASGDVASRKLLLSSIDELEMERTTAQLLEYLRAEPSNSPAWTAPSGGVVVGHPGWVWTITPELVEDRNVWVGFPSFRYLRARVILTTPDGRTLQREALRW